MTFVDLVTGDSCHKFFCVPTPFLSLGQTVPQESKHNRSFQNLNQQLQTTQMMEPFDQLPIKKQKRLANHCMSFMSCQSTSSVCHVAKLSFCYTLLIITMHHSKTSTEAPSGVGRASVGWQHGPSKTEPLSPSSTNMTVKLDPWTNPQANISKQALAYAFNRGMGDGNHASVTKLFSRSSCPKCYNIEINQPANQDRTKAPHAHHHPSSKLATVLKTETFLHKFHCSIGCSFLQPVWSVCTVCAAGRWIHRKPVAEKLCQKIAEGETSLWALGHWDKCFFHHPRGSKNICNVTSSYCQNWFHCFMFTQIQPGQIQRHSLSCPSVKWKQVCRSIIRCPIFELQDWMRCNWIMSTGASWLMMLLRDHPHWQIEELHGVFCNETFKTMTPRLSKPVCQDLALVWSVWETPVSHTDQTSGKALQRGLLVGVEGTTSGWNLTVFQGWNLKPENPVMNRQISSEIQMFFFFVAQLGKVRALLPVGE